jgi:hypothetical protein
MSRKGKPKILLNMIVKNESHIILEALQSVYKYLSYYVINDTGSTDNTREIIKEFFDSKGIPGEIVEHEFRTCKCHGPEYKKYDWFHYGWNRTYAINLCWGKSDYILFMDADDMIVGDLPIDNLTENAYSLKVGENVVHYRTHIVKNRKILGWKYVGGRHEYLIGTKYIHPVRLEGNYKYIARTMGDRSKDANRFLKDAEIFEQLIKEEPNNERHVFYCAQSYYDGRDYRNSMIMYEKRFNMKGFQEECFYSLYRIGLCKKLLNYSQKDIIDAFLRAYRYRPSRVEPYYEIISYLKNMQEFEKAYEYKNAALKIPYPENDVLFVYKDIYDFLLLNELGACAFYLNKFDEAYMLWNKIIVENRCSNDVWKNIILSNIEQVKMYKKIFNADNKPKMVIYTGYSPDSSLEDLNLFSFENFIKNLSEKFVDKYNVYVFGFTIKGSCVKGVNYLNNSFLKKFAEDNVIDILIITRYIHYFLEYDIYAHKIFFILGDCLFQPYWNGQMLPNNGIHLYNNIKHNIDKIIVLSKWHYDNVVSLLPKEVNKVCSVGYFTENFKNPNVERIKYRFVSTLNIRNDIVNLINKFKLIKNHFKNATLTIIDDPNNYKDINIPDYITISFCPKNDDILKELYMSEYWIYPSVYPEGYCFAAHIAMYCGCLCISSKVGSLENILFNRGILVDIDKGPDSNEYWNSLVDKLDNLDKSELIKNMCLENSKTWVESQNIDNIMKTWADILE